MANMAICLFLRSKKKSIAVMMGMRTSKYFILGIRLFWYSKDTFGILYILTTHTALCTRFFQKTKIYLKRQLRIKVTIMSIKKSKLKV